MSLLGINVAAISAANYYTQSSSYSAATANEISSGSALANPTENPADVAVSGNLSALSNQLGAAGQGVQDAISFGQTVNGYLSTVQQGVAQLSTLAQEATNGSLNPSDLQNYSTVFNSIQQALTNITNNASVNGTPIFANGSITTSSGGSNTASIMLSTTGTPSSLGISGLNISTPANAQAALQPLSTALQMIGNRQAEVSADVSALTFYNSNIQTQNVDTQEANARISDVNVAQQSTVNAANNIQSQFSLSVLAQANSSQKSVLQLLTT